MKKAVVKNFAYFKMWATSFALETGVSLLVLPGPFIVGRHVTRIMLDSFVPVLSDLLFKLDHFSAAGFLLFASRNLIRASISPSSSPGSHQNSQRLSAPMITDPTLPSSSASSASAMLNDETAATSFAHHSSVATTGAGGVAAVSNAFLYQLPTTALHLVKLLYRVHRLGMKRTRFFRCIGVMALQYVARVPLMSFSTMLPMSDTELAFCVSCIIVDKTAESYLWYHTFPIPDFVSEAGIIVPSSSSGTGTTTAPSK
jgi:hypothetical protein